jgi:hypothetical protein
MDLQLMAFVVAAVDILTSEENTSVLLVVMEKQLECVNMVGKLNYAQQMVTLHEIVELKWRFTIINDLTTNNKVNSFFTI